MTHQARKRFGQNFLQDQSVIERMLNYLRLENDDPVIEVGPGLGALTLPLLERLDRLTVVEIDRDLIERLHARELPGLSIFSGDVLKLNLNDLHEGRRLRIVGNLPYNIGTPLLLRLLDSHELIKDIHVMLQKEVVDRLHAQTNTRAYGRLSVMMQSVFDIEALFTVPPEAFNPAPKVQSAVVRLKPKASIPDKAILASLEAATRQAFANKRKTLRNNLKPHLNEAALRAIEIDPQARAETLDLDAFHRLAKRLNQL
ncbi:MAG: 16S rRNA (adenine(1518)-N(6)/adenine(1519)-N(6))-dimethyltransferase RsmA [Granulosicoccus sp.]